MHLGLPRRARAPSLLAILAALPLVAVACGAPLGGTAPGSIPAATVADFPGNEATTPLLVDAAWLRDRLGGGAPGQILILDLSRLATYRAGHVPGAVHAWWQDTMDRFYPVYGVVLSDR